MDEVRWISVDEGEYGLKLDKNKNLQIIDVDIDREYDFTKEFAEELKDFLDDFL